MNPVDATQPERDVLGRVTPEAGRSASGAPAPIVLDCCDQCGREMVKCGWCGSYVDQHPCQFADGTRCEVPVDVEPQGDAREVIVLKASCGYPAEYETRCDEC